MADEKIQLTFLGKWAAGEAFKQGDADMKKFQKSVKDMRGVVAGQLGEITHIVDGQLNVYLNRSLNLVNEMARGGIWGAIGAVATQGVAMAAEAMKQLVDMASEAHDKTLALMSSINDFQDGLKRSFDSKAIKAMSAALKEATTEAHAAMTALESASANRNAVSGAQNSASSAAAQEKIATLVKAKAEAVAASLDEYAKNIVKAEKDLEISKVELAEATRSAAAGVETASRNFEDAQSKQMQAIDNLVAAQRAVEIAENDYKKAKIHGAVKQAEYEAKLNSARDAERDAQLAKAKADADLAVAGERLEEAYSRQSAAVKRAEAKVVELTSAHKDAINKQEDHIRAIEYDTSTLESIDKERLEELSALKDRKSEVEKNRTILLKENANKSDSISKDIKASKKLKDNIEKGILADNKTHEWMPHNFKRNSDGTLANMKDVSRASRAYEREQAKLAARRDRQRKAIDNEMGALDKKGRRNWNNWDKRRYQDLQTQKKYLFNEEDASNKLETLAEERKKILEDSEKHLKEIEESIKNLGLK